jgi:hypothetical protein
MNLVQINERLKDLPMQVIQQYANGMNPEVPPYLALGELQRRELSNKQMAMTQGGQQGQQPSVKEQVEQKAGLMALQQMQQQQVAQQQPRGPMPAPAGIPQPQMQPQAPQAMMARGGLASIPVRPDMFEYAGGGIIAFQSGGDTMGTPSLRDQDLAGQAAELAAKERKSAAIAEKIAELEKRAEELDYVAPEEADKVRAQIAAIAPAAKPAVPTDPSFRRQPDPRTTGTPATKQPLITSNAAPRVDVAQKPPALNAGPNVNSGLKAAAASRSPYFAQADAEIAKPIAAPTAQGIIDEQRALSPEAMREEMMKRRYEERKGRADQERATFEKTRPSGLDDLIRVFGQAGQYKGMSGMGPAYTANQDRKRAEEMALEKRMNELYTAADTQDYEGAKEIYSARAGAMKEANRSYQDRLKARSETLAQLANTDQRSIDAALGRLNDMQLQQMRTAQSAIDAARPGEGERFAAKYLGMIATGDAKGAEAYKDAFLIGKKGEPREDTQAKKIAEERVKIATSLMDPKTKAMQLAGLDALEKGAGGSGGKASGVIDKTNPLLK